MKIGAIGYNYQHKDDFVMDRPDGPGCPFMLLIKEPSIFLINGEEHLAEKNSFVIFTADTPVKYYGKDGIYTDDWVYLSFEDSDFDKFADYSIPFNKLITLGNIDELSQLLCSISYEQHSPKEYKEKIQQHYLEIFLLKLSRMINTSKNTHNYKPDDRCTRFIQLRDLIYAHPDAELNVKKLSENMNMSLSGFQHLYKKIFGVNIKNDIITARMELAKELLISTNLGIKEIASKCGYPDEYGFMKRFKAHYGKTPTQFRSIL